MRDLPDGDVESFPDGCSVFLVSQNSRPKPEKNGVVAARFLWDAAGSPADAIAPPARAVPTIFDCNSRVTGAAHAEMKNFANFCQIELD
jgi:hypothetical protein